MVKLTPTTQMREDQRTQLFKTLLILSLFNDFFKSK